VKPNQAADFDHPTIIRDTDRRTDRPRPCARTIPTERLTQCKAGIGQEEVVEKSQSSNAMQAGFSVMEWEQMAASDLARRKGSSPAVCDAGNELTST
jgi:hypothetical protein